MLRVKAPGVGLRTQALGLGFTAWCFGLGVQDQEFWALGLRA